MFNIYDRRKSFYQWDLNQKLVVENDTINQVHFCNNTSDCSLVCEVYDLDGLRVVDVPNIILQQAKRIYVYGYCGKYTKFSDDFAVIARTKPSDYVYTETEVKTFEALENRMSEVEEIASRYATKDYVDEAINGIEAPQVDLSPYALKKDIPDVSEFQTEEEVLAIVSRELGVIENGTY